MPVNFQLNRAGFDFLHFECVEHPEDQIHDHQEGDQLLRHLLFYAAALSTDNVRDKQRLQTDLYDTQNGGNQNRHVLYVVQIESTSNQACEKKI